MHELFVTTVVENDDFETSLRILQGYAAMPPTHFFSRKLFWEPRNRNFKPLDNTFLKQQPPLKSMYWKSLSDQLTRQPYLLATLYEVGEDEFGKADNVGNPEQLLDQRFGTLRWNDLPDPTSAKPLGSRLPDPGHSRPVNSRLVVTIDDQQGLCTIMKKMQYKFAREMIQECNIFVNGDVVFELSRYLLFPTSDSEPAGTMRTTLPAMNTLAPYDSENKWILTASVLVAKGDDPQQMKQGMDQLAAVKKDLDVCFDFKAMDRHIFDTRVKM